MLKDKNGCVICFFFLKKKDAECHGQVNLENATRNKATPGS